MGTGIKVSIMCPGPVFSNLLSIAATERAGEVRIKSTHFFKPNKNIKIMECSSLKQIGSNQLHNAHCCPKQNALIIV